MADLLLGAADRFGRVTVRIMIGAIELLNSREGT
jgi:hypothetical protein